MPATSSEVEAAWESHKSTILDLYFAKSMTLEKIMSHMKQNHGKESAVYFNRMAIAPEKVNKEISRHDVPTYFSGKSNTHPEEYCQLIEVAGSTNS
jgi:Clr5 domain